jgi:hypothetical protein
MNVVIAQRKHPDMEERVRQHHPRTEQCLTTVAFGSLLVFASVMPPLTPTDEGTGRTANPSDPHATSRDDAGACSGSDHEKAA